MDASELLGHVRLMPVVTLDSEESALVLGAALLEAGFAAIEVTLRTDRALYAIRALTETFPDLVIGAGSIRMPMQFAQAAAAGAQFAVSPGASESLLAAVNMPWLPGAATASECIVLLERGYRMQKFFPAESLGGTGTIRSLSAPLPEVRFCPTGGINASRAPDYFRMPSVACVGGSWFIPEELLRAGDHPGLVAAAAAALALVPD